jgi:hypothetical protein
MAYVCKQLRAQSGIHNWFMDDIWAEGYTAQRIYDNAGLR